MSKLSTKLSANQFVYAYSRMWPYVKPIWKIALFSLLAAIPVGMLDSAIALFLKPYTDEIIVNKNMSSPWFLPLLIVGFTVFQGGLIYLVNYLNTWVGGKIVMSLKEDLYAKLLTMEPGYFDNLSSGTVIQRFASDADASCAGLLENLKNLIVRISSSIALVGVLFYNSWHLALMAVVILAITIAPVTQMRRMIKKIVARSVIFGAAINSTYNETYSGNRTITAYNLQKDRKEKFDGLLSEVFNLSMKMIRRTGWISPFMHITISIGVALAISIGSWLIVSETITPGNFVSFLAALLLLYTPIKTLGRTFEKVQISFLAIDRVFEILDREPLLKEKENAVEQKDFEKNIEIENLSFAYNENKLVLKDINLNIRKGETLALVGASGGGKSTLANLIPRFYDATSGSIKMDGIDIRDMSFYSLRNIISVVFQDSFLFHATIRQNILYGNENATEAEIEQAIKSSCLWDFIQSLPDGLDTEIGERGVLLSGGQKQRLSIARAFLKNAPILILDEATSALDSKSEHIVQEAINNLMQNKTVIVIAHRLSTIRNANNIAVIHEGEMVEIGKHEDLIKVPNGHYSNLYHLQYATKQNSITLEKVVE